MNACWLEGDDEKILPTNEDIIPSLTKQASNREEDINKL